ncbi:MAG: alpha-D-ribose 1-methylphosphonate 5-triphosphate diphosphatase [Pelistega sp.]|nr:alpha-D-ribose 1-methylphosphonate 5-triphosphate diphosphatase [Pelistega sp.]
MLHNEQVYTNAKIVLADEVINGSVVVRDGKIAAIDSGNSQVSHAKDWQGDYLMPGFVELHTDNLEKYMNPRPGVDWPSDSAVMAHDAQIIGAGITTVFDALSIGDVNPKGYRLKQLPRMVEAIQESMNLGFTRSEHFLHLRCEVSHERTLEIFEQLIGNSMVHLVSLMDHTPGQRQFVKLEKYREYYQGKYHLSNDEMEAFIIKQKASAEQFSEPNRLAIAKICQDKGLAMASHDDATTEHVEESASFGMSIAEFPTTHIAADKSHELGLKVLMGAPNIVRGGSHSGNIAAADLVKKGVLDILSSDYYPASLLAAVYRMHKEELCDLPSAVATISRLPAQAANLLDRGEIRVGLRADMVRVKPTTNQFVVAEVFNQGNRVF